MENKSDENKPEETTSEPTDHHRAKTQEWLKATGADERARRALYKIYMRAYELAVEQEQQEKRQQEEQSSGQTS